MAARLYAVGDVHGHLDRLAAAHALIAADRRRTGDSAAPVVHLGDVVDRGPESAAVIEYLIAGPARGGAWITLKGNHDYMFALFLRDPALRDPGLRSELSWLHPNIGGAATLASYGIPDPANLPLRVLMAECAARVPPAHRAFLDAMPLTCAAGDVLCVHAGIRPGVPLAEQSPTDLMWIRRDFHDSRADHGPLIVHGHTPAPRPEHHGNRVNLDTGAAYGGPLTAAVIEGRDVWELTPAGRVAVVPPAGLEPATF